MTRPVCRDARAGGDWAARARHWSRLREMRLKKNKARMPGVLKMPLQLLDVLQR